MKQSKKQPVEIEERMLASGTVREYSIERVVKELGSTDHYVNFKGQMVAVSKLGGNWHGVAYA